ncbi:uncharacterized protein LOC118277501 [Spodoptera frugiperda]|uniref:Uncharacterized protein LOC118277501 n=1 Tax=Spodoptera frugiperda TaxID=7108 RepID=A0A9R0DGC0_SPOFR|nr:uncharacterized protein LOC118277501 [Spodoptera frugiperda]
MGKPPYIYTESESEDTSISSTENKKKKKKRFSILKYTRRSVKKQKCKLQSKSEPDDSDYHSKGSNVRYKIPGILKHSHVERERETSDDDSEPMKPKGHDKYLVGRVPRPAGTKPGRGGGVAIIVKKHVNKIPGPQSATTSPKRTKASKLRRLSKKRSF